MHGTFNSKWDGTASVRMEGSLRHMQNFFSNVLAGNTLDAFQSTDCWQQVQSLIWQQSSPTLAVLLLQPSRARSPGQ